MPPSVSDPPPRRAFPLLGLFALANIGGVIAYLPLLALIVPMKVEAISHDGRIELLSLIAVAGAIAASKVEAISHDGRIELLSLIAVAGAIAASGANVLFGWLSDRSQRAGRGRRRWIAIGLVAITTSYAGIGLAATPATLVGAILCFQFAVNALLAPLMASMAEEIPDAQRGMAGGLIALGNPAASALSAWLVGEAMLGEGGRLAVVVLMILLCTLPLVVTGNRSGRPSPRIAAIVPAPRRDFWVAGLSRLLIQVAAVVTQVYLLYYFETIVPSSGHAGLPRWVGQVFTLAFIVPLPIALVLGRLVDRTGRRRDVLLLAALAAALGLFAMAAAESRSVAATAFILYTAGSSVFVALHSGLSFQLLPDPRHRGRDLGVFNLANTLPTLMGSGLAWTFATPQDFGTVLVLLAMITIAGGLAILGVRTWR